MRWSPSRVAWWPCPRRSRIRPHDRLDLALPDAAVDPHRPPRDPRRPRLARPRRRRQVPAADRDDADEAAARRPRDEEGVRGRARAPEPRSRERDQEARALRRDEGSCPRAGGDEQPHRGGAPRVPGRRRRSGRVAPAEPPDAPTDGTGAQARPPLRPPKPAPPPAPLWRNRDFVLLWSGQVVSTIGTRVTGIAFPLLVLAQTHSPARAGIVGFVQTLPYMLFYLPAGALVDRWDRKRVMLVADAGRALALGSLAVALAAHASTFAHVIVVAFVE